ncbi:type II toxin-antitoxin system RelE/ParE family toxin [Geofilum sp. OHC36d9]|uniref:type II toxin-antitoxin system RelE/ParE family toxin n=1 Tax=Geofilum sp. OHC36d9 TaxID=3458413 RepID=UPI004033EC22
MDQLKIFWTKTAKKQRDHIFDYWNKRNKSNSYTIKLNSAIGEKVALIKFHPEIGKTTNFGDTRAISMKHYSILYTIDNSRIIITGFWDNRQNPEKLLKFLKK